MRAVCMTLFATVLVMFAAVPAAAQQTGTVTGIVTDAMTGQPLVGVQIQIAGTNLGGLTGTNGRYLLTRIPAGEQNVRAIIIGYAQATETVTVPAGGSATADFQLRVSAVPLEALVVHGVTGREQRARELGTKTGSIDMEAVNPAPVMSFAEALGGRTTGVVMQDVGGTTGTSQRIRIRGANSLSLSNEPMIVIDGILVTNNQGGLWVGGEEVSRLNDLNPNDIANIEVVKGPAASALYGTAAANGVILITTKRGRPGATQWNAFVEMGRQDDVAPYKDNYLTFQRTGSGPLFQANGLFNSFSATLRPDGHTLCPNWRIAAGVCDPAQVETLQFNTLRDSRTTPFSTGTRGRYGASVRGGTDEVRYFVSGQYEDEVGVIDFNTLEKVSVRANLDAALAPTTDLSISFGYTDSALGLNNNDNSIFSPILNGLVGRAYYVPRADGADDENRLNYGWGFTKNDLSYLVTYQDVDRLTTSSTLRWRPLPWLSVNATGGLDYASRHDYNTLQPGSPMGWLAVSYDEGFRESWRTNSYLYTTSLSGVGTFNLTSDLLSTTTLGTSYSLDNIESTYCYGYSLVPGTASCGTVAEGFSIDETFFEVRTLGGYVQQELAWRDRVFLAGGLRADDNSAFGAGVDLAYYPSASLSWVIAEEPWFPQTDLLSTLRLRTAWGVSGLRPGFRNALTIYTPQVVATDEGDRPGVRLSVTGNELLKPERSSEVEFGFDTGLFGDRLSVEFTYYDKSSTDALISRRLPGSIGLTPAVFDNLGEIRNWGTELGLNLDVYQGRNFGLAVGLSNTTINNEVVALGEGVDDIVFNRGLQRHTEGYTAGGFWQRPVIWSDPDGDGYVRIADVSLGDEEEFIGPSVPKWQRSLTLDGRLWDWLSVSTLIEGRGGHYQANDTEAFRCYLRVGEGCAAVADPSTPAQQQAEEIAYSYLGSMYGWIERADFYKWRELSVSLTVPTALRTRVPWADGVRLTLAGRNLATWTDYSGVDPEAVETSGGNFHQSEFNTQPPVRYMMVRLDYTF
jgi:TonB-dependent starch-binding outer membrane protein SusC